MKLSEVAELMEQVTLDGYTEDRRAIWAKDNERFIIVYDCHNIPHKFDEPRRVTQ